jgi:hypothetical protein
MRRVKPIGVLLLVAIWLPASSHALLQQAGIIHQQHGHEHVHGHDTGAHAGTDSQPDPDGRHEHAADNHAAADGLCLLASGKVQVPVPAFAALPGWLPVALLTPSADAHGVAMHQGLSPPGTSPPGLSHTWQFSCRASLRARAPSSLS